MEDLILRSTTEVSFEEQQEINEIAYIIAATVLVTIGIFGFFFNLLVIVIIVKEIQTSWTPINIILLNLVVGDFLVAVLGNPVATISAINGRWYWNNDVCLWYAWLMTTLGMTSIGNLTIMAVERWLLITRPMMGILPRHAVYLSVFVWIYALFMSVPPMLGWGSYGPEAGNLSCSVSWEVHDSTRHTDSYVAFLFTFGLFLPLIIISSSYSSILITIRNVKKKSGSKRRQEAMVTKMVTLMIFAFLFAWLPYACMAMGVQYFNVKMSPTMAMIPALLAKTSICYNPVIYAGMNTQLSKRIKKLVGIRDDDTRKGTSDATAMTPIQKRTQQN